MLIGEPTPDATASALPPSDSPDLASLDDAGIASALGLNYETLNDEERAFIRDVAEESRTDTSGFSPDNPLIPLASDDADDADDATSTATSTDDDAASPEGADDVGGPPEVPSGPASEAPGDAAAGSLPPAASPTSATPPWEALIPPTSTAPDTVHIEGIGDIPTHIARQALGMYESLSADELAVIAAIRQGQPIPVTAQPQTLPPAEEWDDPQAAAAFQALHQQVTALSQGQSQVLEALAAEQERVMGVALDHGVQAFREAFPDLDDNAMQVITNAVVANDLLPAYVRAAQGDVTQGTRAALEATYWSDPARRQAWLDSQVAAHTETVTVANGKKAKAAALVSSPGNAARNAAPTPKRGDRDGQLAGMAAFLEADMNSTNGNG